MTPPPAPGRRSCLGPAWIVPLVLVVTLVVASGCAAAPAERAVRAGAEGARTEEPSTSPAASVPAPPSGGAEADVRWTVDRVSMEAVVDDEPSSCRTRRDVDGWYLDVAIGPDEPGSDRGADALRLTVGPLAGAGRGRGFTAAVREVRLVVAGGGVVSEPVEGRTTVSSDLRRVEVALPEVDGKLVVTCGP